ncbi:MAG: DUF4124 domain-containing protein [Ketobacteraceae bacterium]|nr:DUF4124 domain-containing protein [Ketobacteraceae bacterium]
MKSALVILLLPLLAHAEIYHCQENGKEVFSDSPCGTEARVIEVQSPGKTGTQLSNESMKAVSKALEKDRQKRELDRAVENQRIKIDQIREKFREKLDKLNAKLAALEEKTYHAHYTEHPRISLEYRQSRRDLEQKIRELKSNHRYRLEKARNKLKRLKEERQALK